ncbi:MAG TPA: nitronate monooxygenase [Thermoanaerobaculia bacterium]|nr:nitronate monooxygenase [Thermoanaerobaculia bacterium]
MKVDRRHFIEMTAATAAACASGAAVQSSPELHTPLCDLLGIRHPIVQAGMAGVAGPDLVAAVSRAGGLGILTGTLLPPDELRKRIHRVRELTDKPFGVNLLLHHDLQPPKSLEDPSRAAPVQRILNRFRTALGLPNHDAAPPAVPDLLGKAMDILIDEKVPVWSIGLGIPTAEMVDRFHKNAAKVIVMAATVDDAEQMAAAGVDAIIAQGSEAGGHRSTSVKRASTQEANIGCVALVPQIADRVRVPVIAAGGIVDGRGLAAALALGASGVVVGTRFILSRESIAPQCHKDALLHSSSDATVVSDAFTGMYARVVRNDFTNAFAGEPVLPPFLQFQAAADVVQAAGAQNRGEYYTLYGGQGIGSMRDLPPAAEIVEGIVRQAVDIIRRMRQS